MNLYLVLALALGAVSVAPAPQAATPRVIAQRSERSVVCGPASAGRVVRDRLKPVLTPYVPGAARLVNTGAASPRAPARS